MAMKYVAAYLMAVLSGNESPSRQEVEKILESVGIEVEGDVLQSFLNMVERKTAHELIAAGWARLQSVPAGGGGVAMGSGGGGLVAAVDSGGSKQEEKKEEEEEEEEEGDMGFSLFD